MVRDYWVCKKEGWRVKVGEEVERTPEMDKDMTRMVVLLLFV